MDLDTIPTCSDNTALTKQSLKSEKQVDLSLP